MKRIKLTIGLTSIILLMLASPAQACACAGYAPWDFADWFNSQSYEFRASANTLAPLGFAFTTDYRMVGMNLCGQTEECF